MSDGGEDQGAEEAFMCQKKEESSRQFWKEPSRASGSSFSARGLDEARRAVRGIAYRHGSLDVRVLREHGGEAALVPRARPLPRVVPRFTVHERALAHLDIFESIRVSGLGRPQLEMTLRGR